MTRFARAAGSKSSNERHPEQATDWKTMKKDLEKSKADAEMEKQRAKINQIRQTQYDNFVKETEEKVKKNWVEFPVDKKTPQSPKKKGKKSPAKLITEEVVSEEMIDESIESDEESDEEDSDEEDNDEEDSDSQNPIEPIFPKKDSPAKSQQKKMDKKQKFKKVNSDDDAPEEMSAKIPLKQNVNNKQKSNMNGNKQNNAKQVRGQKRNIAKEPDNEEHHKPQKRKKDEKVALIVDGVEEKLTYFQGFPIRQAEAERLTDLRKTMLSKGVPSSQVERTLKQLRRKSERETSRLLKKICYQCRKSGHVLSDCPEVGNNAIETVGSGICYKCGSTEHSHLQCRGSQGYKFATCFICREQGHISRECPDNPRGLYPDGGSCKFCGDVTHLKKDCPNAKQEEMSNELVVDTIAQSEDIESLDSAPKTPKITPVKQKVVTF